VKNKDFYKIKFNDGVEVVACGEHRWIAKDSKRRFRKNYKKGNKIWDNESLGVWSVFTTEDMIKIGKNSPKPKSNYTKFSIPVCEAIQFCEKKYSVDPYFLGVILGDGSISGSNGSISKKDKQISNFLLSQGCTKRAGYVHGIPLEILNKLKDLGLLGKKSDTKFIPEPYFYGSVEQRKLLLAGLLDTDGFAGNDGSVEYNTASPLLSEGVVRLVTGLGGTAEVKKRGSFYRKKSGEKVVCKDSYRIKIKTIFNPFILQRKKDRWKKVEKYKHERVIDCIEKIGLMDGRCIMVDNKDSSYLIGL